MLENAIYSILSPEGYASILWKDASKVKEAANIMKMTAKDLYKFGVIDKIVKEPEGGARCGKCFYLRMYETALKAKDEGYEYFGTTLTVSPHKNSQVINKIGETIANNLGIKYIYGDFKKNDGYKKSIEFSKTYNLYRQDYCGCLFGKETRNGSNK